MRNVSKAGISAVLVAIVGLVVACGGDRPDRATPEAADAAVNEEQPAPPAGAAGVQAENGDGTEAAPAAADALTALPVVTVYKSPTCGCCTQWVAHMRDAGFEVETHDVTDLPSVKSRHGVPTEHQSCHTATVGDYVVEGHVPADLVHRLLEERPDVAGLAVPGMPRGSPGMEVPDGTTDPYDVIAFTEDGSDRVYASR